MADLTTCSRVQFGAGSAAVAALSRYGSDEKRLPSHHVPALSSLQIIFHPIATQSSPVLLVACLHLEVSSSSFLKTNQQTTQRYH
jgi:hypothetical protein